MLHVCQTHVYITLINILVRLGKHQILMVQEIVHFSYQCWRSFHKMFPWHQHLNVLICQWIYHHFWQNSLIINGLSMHKMYVFSFIGSNLEIFLFTCLNFLWFYRKIWYVSVYCFLPLDKNQIQLPQFHFKNYHTDTSNFITKHHFFSFPLMKSIRYPKYSDITSEFWHLDYLPFEKGIHMVSGDSWLP